VYPYISLRGPSVNELTVSSQDRTNKKILKKISKVKIHVIDRVVVAWRADAPRLINARPRFVPAGVAHRIDTMVDKRFAA